MFPAAKTAVLTAHGQPSAPEGQEKALARLAQQVSDLLPGWEIRSATLSSPGRLEQVMQDGALVYPFFMASGWFTSQVLPKRLQGFRYDQLPAFGLDPALPLFTADLLKQAFQPQPSSRVDKPALLLAAHGSARGPKAAEATERFAQVLRPLLPDQDVVTGYIEQAPRIADAAQKLPTGSLCLPFFAQSGNHVTSDLPSALREANFTGETLPTLGSQRGIARLISQALLQAALARNAPPSPG
ncbi:CbiX/SirB N-terminal domain-containing protein [Pseudophaeobacter sp.]|uniref:CbiX/SirB N-terminal domain-containing protein n=1 Tax=Pseudophaeobacter sp. TaxID=1971739 RepID=UPI003299D1D8